MYIKLKTAKFQVDFSNQSVLGLNKHSPIFLSIAMSSIKQVDGQKMEENKIANIVPSPFASANPGS